MDHILTREESKRLMELLNLPMTEYGNFPLMRRAFLKACKILHPDKGGNAEQAQELISLYRKLEESLPSLNPQESFTTDQVSVSSDTMGFYLKDWKACIKGNPLCMCLFCLLKESHSRKNKNRRPKVWGACYCFECYILWFGLEYTYYVCCSWMGIIANLPFGSLNI
ncbi:small T antigen [Panthera leo polyomavirus 1]|uniref:Small t antigen n=1 Tax=Panthera leo polyomavirus 1 TaxID=2170405 RepID=A0A2S1CJN7_9POLY|nr:small T antigen [Panthera leo polyomavirus 1]AWD33774.1 small T antigen [Panthera leo polyomavirus 1]AWD33785.1 small T antigen [Panthera leo polyomavirus 1]